ncbi:LPS export ABC transporter periplasmic protein LptC [Hymenobacter sp. 15J16-1T3B]|uniref:OstA-like protein n=1 Tax=Hymenobacter sp. 15J16-1T3B TaxID=2886941 RepID=UPI001D11ED3F|nr:OstA-like protein [Hymenobacter sp. 15J16-1T3B]MCC3158757.1 LPS export ABC transporter periplasmic protein LptC [Hymenobacter sp. 15J16-1T3B]
MRLRILFCFFFLLLTAPLAWAQRPGAQPAPRPAAKGQPAPKASKVELLPGARELVGGSFNGQQIRKVIGNVSFRQDDALLFCDSAYQYVDRNAIEAFSNVRVVQNDTITITGDRGAYNGDTRTARMTGNVVMRDPRMTLTTQTLDYDLNRKTAFYSTGGHLTDPENTLDSQRGYYNTETQVFSFRTNVKLVTKDYTITNDTLQYNTQSKVAYFFGPTRIVGKQGNIYAEKGTYNTRTRVSDFQRNAKIETPNYLLGGDKLVYDETRQYGVATGNVSMTAKKDNVVIRGDVGRYWRGLGRAKVYGSPVMRNISDRDTMYLAADTLVNVESKSETDPGIVYAYRKVRIWRGDLQGRCDSLTYNRRDSVIYLNRNPVLWSQKNQLTADSMEVRLRRQKIDQMRLYANSFIIGQDTLLNFNQVKGRNMVAYFVDSKLRKVNVLGNAESLYYALDNDTATTGLNKAVSANMVMRFADNKLQTISFLTEPDASFIPPHEFKPEDQKLKGFQWLIEQKPTRRQVLGKHFAPVKKAKPKAKKPVKKTTKPAPKPVAKPVAGAAKK